MIDKPEIVNNNYRFTEILCGGYISRGSYDSITVITIWDKNLNLLELNINDKDMLIFFNEKGKLKKLPKWQPMGNKNIGDLDYDLYGRTAVRAKNRHLKWLRIYLGLDKEPVTKTGKFIVRYSYKANLYLTEKLLTKKGTPNFGNQRYILWTVDTPEKRKIAKEYNEKKKQFDKYEKDVIDKLFKDKNDK